MNRRYLGVFFVLLSAAGFGLMPIFALHAYRGGINIPTLLWLRFSAAAVFLFAWVFAQNHRVKVTWRQAGWLFVMGGVLYALQSTMYFSALKHISASLTALLLYTYPIIVALLSALVEKERPTGRLVAAIPLCFAGLVLALGVTIDGIEPVGVAFALGAALVYSCYIVSGNRLLRNVPPLVTSAFVSLSAAISFALTGLARGALTLDFAPVTWLPLAGIVICSTVVAILGFFKGMELIGPTAASVLSMAEPVVTIALSMLLLEERLGPVQFGGIAAVLAGALLAILRAESPSDQAAPARAEAGKGVGRRGQ